MAFVDISGFTKLSERLVRHGTVGAEELSDTINRCFVELLAVAYVAAGYRSGAASVKGLLGRVACGEARYAQAQALFEESLQEAQGVGGHVEVLDTRARMAECQLLAGDAEGALAAVREALAHSRLLGGVSAQHPLLFRIRGAALMRLGDHNGARGALEESLRTAAARGADYELALTLRVVAHLDERAGTRSHPEAQAQAAAILNRLGVVWTSELV